MIDINPAWIIFNPIFLGQSRLNMKCWGWMEGRKWTKWMKLSSPKEKTRKLNGDRIHRVFLQQKWKSWNLFLVQKPCLLSITLNNSLFFSFLLFFFRSKPPSPSLKLPLFGSSFFINPTSEECSWQTHRICKTII